YSTLHRLYLYLHYALPICKHRAVDPNILSGIFFQLVDQIKCSQPSRSVMPLKIIDSSTIPLNLRNHPWATFRKTKAGVKLHLKLDRKSTRLNSSHAST